MAQKKTSQLEQAKALTKKTAEVTAHSLSQKRRLEAQLDRPVRTTKLTPAQLEQVQDMVREVVEKLQNTISNKSRKM